MKKTRQIKLRLVRALQSQELQQVEGGGGTIGRLPQTGDSRNECCA
jgi:hypothetical protein